MYIYYNLYIAVILKATETYRTWGPLPVLCGSMLNLQFSGHFWCYSENGQPMLDHLELHPTLYHNCDLSEDYMHCIYVYIYISTYS